MEESISRVREGAAAMQAEVGMIWLLVLNEGAMSRVMLWPLEAGTGKETLS